MAGAEQAQALWYVGPGKAEIRGEALSAPGAGEVRVRALFSALSRGTERLILSGGVPESEYRRMRAPHMGGDFPFPVKYGYAMVGRAEAGPDALKDRVVFALHPHQTFFNLSADAVVPVPDGVPPQRAALAANMETALNAIWDGEADTAKRIAIVGAGVLGLLVARLCGKLGADVTVVDIETSRAAIAKALGVAFATPDAAPTDCDLVVHASASEQGLATALRLAAFEATVLELSWYGAKDVKAPLGGAFHSRRLKLVSSQVGHVAPARRALGWTHRRRLEEALRLLDDPALDTLLAPPVAFADLAARLPDILGPASGVLCQLVRYPAN